MSRIIRTFAVTGAAAAALLGTAGTVHAATTEEATATVEAAVDRAAGAPVTLPSGKTLHVRGLDTVAYRADDVHHQTLASVVADTRSAGVGVVPAGLPASTPQQVQTQAAGGSISVVAMLGIGLAIFTFFMIKKGRINAWHAAALVMFGVVLAPTTFGPLLQSLGVSAAGALGNIWSGF
ncbi:hypothetical protein ACFXAZ_34410 [Streptomyces sp. NPDC059477]|uniref:hypothetical protein n=1 Tax=Streptomyces sp. NPDC059477 TaxID=3346847 RepID=UPI0036A5A100